MNVGIYARLSRNDGESTSIDRQIADCRSRFRADWVETAVYQDDDLSAWNQKVQRPEYDRMLADIDSGRVQVIIARALDRLLRHPREWERLWERCEKAGVNIVTVHEGVDTATTFGREVVPRMLAIFAKMESDNISARVRSKHDELRRTGRWSGGRRAFGLNDGWSEVIPEEAEAIREAAERVLEGWSLNAIMRDWNERDLRTRTGKPWDATSVKRVLTSPRMVGRRWSEAGLSPAGIPAILDEETWRSVCVVLLDPERRKRRPDARYLLSGLLYCGRCGNRLYADKVAAKQAQKLGAVRYECVKRLGGCGTVSIRAERTEEEVMRQWVSFTQSSQWKDMVERTVHRKPSQDRVATEKGLRADRERLYGLMDQYATGDLTMAEWQRARALLVERIQKAERDLSEAKDIDPETKSLFVTGLPNWWARQWRVLDDETKRRYLSFAWERIDVMPATKVGRRFDPTRIQPVARV